MSVCSRTCARPRSRPSAEGLQGIGREFWGGREQERGLCGHEEEEDEEEKKEDEKEEEKAPWASLLELSPTRRVNREETGWRKYLEWKIKKILSRFY